MNFHIIPQPSEIKIFSEETAFCFSEETHISFSPEFKYAANDLIRFCEEILKINCIGGENEIAFIRDPSLKSPEGYTVRAESNRITISATDGAGGFYAVQTLKQLLIQSSLRLPFFEICDHPRYSYRGFMLDCAAHFLPVEDIKLFLDAMALHKLNRFHWHLTDDQGWRLELYNNLLLAQIGSHRSCTGLGKTPHSGFYSRQDAEEILSYAKERYITVIPGIDSPGHITAAVAAYPQLSCFPREVFVETTMGEKSEALCIGKSSSIQFMFSVFDEVCEIFSSDAIHISSGDASTKRWKLCPDCQKKMKELGLENEGQLQTFYLSEIASRLEQHGRKAIVKNGIAAKALTSESIIRESSSEPSGPSPFFIHSSDSFCFSTPYDTLTLKGCCKGRIPENRSCLGAEAKLYTAYISDIKAAGHFLFPRLGIFCEKVWSGESSSDYEDFISKLSEYENLLNSLPFSYASFKQAQPSFFRKNYIYKAKIKCNNLIGKLKNAADDKRIKKLTEKEKQI